MVSGAGAVFVVIISAGVVAVVYRKKYMVNYRPVTGLQQNIELQKTISKP